MGGKGDRADRLLLGTDTPLYHAGMQRARIETAEIPDDAKRLILHENALHFFWPERRSSQRTSLIRRFPNDFIHA